MEPKDFFQKRLKILLAYSESTIVDMATFCPTFLTA